MSAPCLEYTTLHAQKSNLKQPRMIWFVRSGRCGTTASPNFRRYLVLEQWQSNLHQYTLHSATYYMIVEMTSLNITIIYEEMLRKNIMAHTTQYIFPGICFIYPLTVKTCQFDYSITRLFLYSFHILLSLFVVLNIHDICVTGRYSPKH